MRDYAGFFLFVLLIIMTLFAAWYGLKSYGLAQPVSAYQTPLAKSLSQISQNQALLWRSDAKTPYRWVDLQFSEGQWSFGHKPSASLKELLDQEARNANPLLLFFEARDAKALPQLRELFKNSDLWKKTIFCSRYDGLLKDLRELEPKWTFCSGEGFLVRLLAFSSINLASLLNISADVVFIHLGNSNLSKEELAAIIQEAKRQRKLVFIGPVRPDELTRLKEGLQPDGWMVVSEDQKVQ